MKKIRLRPIFVILRVFFAAVLIYCASCAKRQEASQMITESQAIEIAKVEFKKSGRKLEDYDTSVGTESTGHKWMVWFIRRGKYVPAGGKHFVIVEKYGGKATFMPGE